MIALADLLKDCPVTHVPDLLVGGITDDSREVTEGDLFVAVQGAASDGHDYIAAAIDRGAVAILAERDQTAAVPLLVVDDLKRRRSELAGRVYDQPAAALTCDSSMPCCWSRVSIG